MGESLGKSTWNIKCTAPACQFGRERIESKSVAKRHADAHSQWGNHKVDLLEVKPLSKKIRVNDRIRLKDDRANAVVNDCKRAGWSIDHSAIRIVERIDDFGPGGSERLFVEGPPFAFRTSDVMLAWNSDDERRKGLGL
jgi:hypothetical protein